MTKPLRVTATFEPRGPAGALLLTDEQVGALGGGRKTFPVQVAINGAVLALRLARMGGENMIGMSKAARGEAGVEIGSSYDVEISVRQADQTVDVPADLAAALDADPQVRAAFDALSYTHRKEFVRWVGEAKKETTRAGRVATTVEMVRTGRTR